jgi:hypothetical protein
MNTKCPTLLILSVAGALGCDVDSQGTPNQSVKLDSTADAAAIAPDGDAASPLGADGGPTVIPPPKRRGFVVVESDYNSVNVSVLDSAGDPLSNSLLSSASEDPGLSAALSGDVVSPTSQLSGNEVVLVDRTAGVLNWVNLETAIVRQQVNVGSGFMANPQDYVPYDAHTAFVTRFKTNGAAGEAEFDAGGDVLVLDPTTGDLTAAIDLSTAFDDGTPATPARALMAGGYLRVSLIGWDGAFGYADARLVTIDPETLEIVDVLVFEDIQNCSTLALSPDGAKLALGCSGPYTVEHSGIVVVDVAATPRELLRVAAADLADGQVNSVEFITPDSLAFTQFGVAEYDSEGTETVIEPDSLRILNLATGTADAEPVVESENAVYALADVRCIPESKLCVVAEGRFDGGTLHRFEITEAGKLDALTPLVTGADLQLPPRYLGVY